MAVMQGPPAGQEVAPEVAPEEGVFPKDEEQAEQFLLNIIKVIHEDEEIHRILAESLGKQAPNSTVIGAVAAQILTLMFTQVYEQSEGLSVAPEFAVESVRRAVSEVAEIAKAEGTKVSKEDMLEAAKIAGDTLEQSMDQVYDGAPAQQQAPPVQQQGPPAGQLQGPPQQGGM